MFSLLNSFESYFPPNLSKLFFAFIFRGIKKHFKLCVVLIGIICLILLFWRKPFFLSFVMNISIYVCGLNFKVWCYCLVLIWKCSGVYFVKAYYVSDINV